MILRRRLQRSPGSPSRPCSFPLLPSNLERLTPLFATDPRNRQLTPLFATDPKTPSRKSFACHRSETPHPGPLLSHGSRSTGESEGGMSAPTESRRPRGFWQAYSGFTAALQLAGAFWRAGKLPARTSRKSPRNCCRGVVASLRDSAAAITPLFLTAPEAMQCGCQRTKWPIAAFSASCDQLDECRFASGRESVFHWNSLLAGFEQKGPR